MKVHYSKILLFPLLLNTLAYNKNKPYITTRTPTTTSRVVSECDLYMPKYDNDEDMKSVKENFDRQTSRRFEEYEERMSLKRQKCKEQCDKDIQKIILKDKIEKELAKQLTTLETNIDTNDIPTCVCEKSLADKVEKTCLKCGGILGGGLAPESGLIGGTALYALSVCKPTAIDAAIAAAAKSGAAEGSAAGIKAGIQEVMDGLCRDFGLSAVDVNQLGLVFDGKNYNNAEYIFKAIFAKYQGSCTGSVRGTDNSFCNFVMQKTFSGNVVSLEDPIQNAISTTIETMVSQAETIADVKALDVTASKTTALKMKNMAVVEGICNSYNTAIIASIVAIVVIVLIMVIIYLILRYRRKKKMKKKLQYIKLLKE
ncbi:hypothetical protein PFUGPA_01072 [Plasmodium falciparum Palo Alto/Uganda]|uniref:Rifin n=2 Tax=Plasmodium falciparum TaxID=5833 RepID=W4J4J4_PLAFP|nr:hypothetical protein PFUGPA_01072 [Plasmodium falciparum Palo Alto/Uganda]ETW58818.1 hypothetical protein PFMC_05298 [Plasmodium falciparum CAMP/Malaysia]